MTTNAVFTDTDRATVAAELDDARQKHALITASLNRLRGELAPDAWIEKLAWQQDALAAHITRMEELLA